VYVGPSSFTGRGAFPGSGGESGRQGGLTRTCRFRLETTNRGYETGGAYEWLRSSGLLKKFCLTRGRFRLVSSVCSLDSLLVDVRSSGRQGVGGLTQNYLCSDGIVRSALGRLGGGGEEA
jgi:hypothetical protein